MHSAPSVDYPVGRCRFQALVLGTVGLVSVMACLAWWVAVPRSIKMSAAVLGTLITSVGLLWWNWHTTPTGCLSWDGTGWSWRPHACQDAQLGTVRVCWSNRHCLLLGFVPGASDGTERRWPAVTIWLWLVSDSAPQIWLDVCRAVYSRPGRPAVPQSPAQDA